MTNDENRRPSPSGDADLVERLRAGDTEYTHGEQTALLALAHHCINAKSSLTEKHAKLVLDILTRWEAQRREAAAALEASAPLRAELEEMRRALDFVRNWAWRPDGWSETERLSAIKYHPSIKPKDAP